MAELNERIMVDPSVLVGKPVIRGTRLSVEFIIGLMAERWSEADILKAYPGLVAEDMVEERILALQDRKRALAEAGASMSDVVRTRTFTTDISQWEQFGKAHGEFFRDIRPVSTLVEVSKLIDPAHLVEIEIDALISGD